MKIIKFVFGIYQLILALLGLFFAVFAIIWSVILFTKTDKIIWKNWLLSYLVVIFIVIGVIYCFMNSLRYITGKKEFFAKMKGVLVLSILSAIFLTAIECVLFKQVVGAIQLINQQNSLYKQMAPEFTANSIDGDVYRLSDMKGKYVLLEFWATWCGFCVKDLPNIQNIRDKYSSDELVILGISQDSDINRLREFIEEKHYTFINIYDKEEKLSSLFNVSGIPMNFLIDPEGKIVATNMRGEAILEEMSRRLR